MPDDILHIHGFSGCPFFRRASRAALAAVEEGNLALAQGINIKAHATREEYFSWLHGSFAAELGHTTSPLVFTVASGAFQTPRYIGGCSQLVRLLGAGIVALPPDTARETVGERGAAPDSASAPRVPLVGEVGAPLRVFVAGDRSQVGKSSVCLGLLAALLRAGYSPGELAYIKPATQCESPQLIGKFCGSHGIPCRPIGPIVYYAGFTRAFVGGKLGAPATWLSHVESAVADIGRKARVVVIDGVGYPAVGSICGLSNAAVAQKLHAPVLLVGKKGVGDAVDSFNLNQTYFESRGLHVLGGVFNRLATDGYYSLEKCREAVTNYFSRFKPDKMPYGFVPELECMVGISAAPPPPSSAVLATAAAGVGGAGAVATGGAGEEGEVLGIGEMNESEKAAANAYTDAFCKGVDVARLLRDIASSQHETTSSSSLVGTGQVTATSGGAGGGVPPKAPGVATTPPTPPPAAASTAAKADDHAHGEACGCGKVHAPSTEVGSSSETMPVTFSLPSRFEIEGLARDSGAECGA